MSLRTPLAKVRGLGSAKRGTEHFWIQRLTAVALIPLSIWFVIELLRMTTMDHPTVSQWLTDPMSATLLIMFLLAMFHHAQLGVQVVIEDYVHSEWQKIACLILIKFLALFSGLIGVLSVLKIFLGL